MSIIAKVDLNNSEDLVFDMFIEGADSNGASFRLVIENDLFDIALRGVIEGRTVKFNVPKLAGILSPGTHEAYLDAVVEGDKYFRPFQEQIEFNRPASIKTSFNGKAPIKRTPIKVNASFENKKPLSHEDLKEYLGAPKYKDCEASLKEMIGDVSNCKFVDGCPGVWTGEHNGTKFVANTRSGQVLYDN